jgi:hypothetical protein
MRRAKMRRRGYGGLVPAPDIMVVKASEYFTDTERWGKINKYIIVARIKEQEIRIKTMDFYAMGVKDKTIKSTVVKIKLFDSVDEAWQYVQDPGFATLIKNGVLVTVDDDFCHGNEDWNIKGV